MDNQARGVLALCRFGTEGWQRLGMAQFGVEMREA